MPLPEVLLIACGLAMDAFAVALGAGASGLLLGKRAMVRLSFHFGLFQFMMPAIGWLLAIKLHRFVVSVDHWLAFGLLGFVGARMILAGITSGHHTLRSDPSRGLTLVSLSLATSIDALAVGLSLAFLGTEIWWPSAAIGVVTCGLSMVGVMLGKTLNERVGRRTEIAGGIILVAIGVQILATHLAS